MQQMECEHACGSFEIWIFTQGCHEVEEKFPKENFWVDREMRDEILVYDPFLTKFWAKMVPKCRKNAARI
jgi:hypothetical protein